MRAVSLLSLAAAAAVAQDTVGPWGQCGGWQWVGPTKCGQGYTCIYVNDWYSQCIPGVASTTTTSSVTSTTTTSMTTMKTITTPSAPVTSTIPTTSADSSPTPGTPTPTTLENGWFWIRAVATPYYRSYLQAAPTATAAPIPAVLSKNTGAGQFNVISGQLVYNRFGAGKQQYMHVENPADKTQRKLRTWFDATPNDYGAFAFQGDTLIWTVADITRPNAAAWLVCEGDMLFVNTGAFLYNTPAGCFDHTIHSYGGSKADV
ncbi:hypothetical protein QBC47DRAFT_434299 [Echria macrotheca]|uniref:CBM1 domain-containing protein n=1 Tax=Echria macrotheca TaxID=438768 RepID=A0AAJ0F1L1_9PEZI|nr:hypothetical protein QBC47DRAFT_434299 [Echria macrotheca]